MSMTFSYVAARSPKEAVLYSLYAHPEIGDVLDSVDALGSYDQMLAWCSGRSGYIDGPAGLGAKALVVHEGWSVVLDVSQLLGQDEGFLASISQEVGEVVAAATQGTAGFASFSVYRDGACVRRLVGH